MKSVKASFVEEEEEEVVKYAHDYDGPSYPQDDNQPLETGITHNQTAFNVTVRSCFFTSTNGNSA